MEKTPQVISDDGLVIQEVGAWAETKYRLIGLHAALFSTGMKRKWDQRVYVDLYAGAGYARLRNTQRIVLGSPLVALAVSDPFWKISRNYRTTNEAVGERLLNHGKQKTEVIPLTFPLSASCRVLENLLWIDHV